jgi:hypothetical protein
MTSIVRLARRLRSEERAMALPIVIGIGLAMLMLVATALSVTGAGLRKTNTDEDYIGALAAAYAGVEEYQSRLANDSTYQKYGNPASPYTSATGSTVSLPIGANANPAFGIGTSGTWATVASAAGAATSVATFRYEIDNHDYASKGVLHLRSTGRVGNVTRTVVADLKQKGFIDYVYFTNYETPDPSYIGGYALTTDASTGDSMCARYLWGPSSSRRVVGSTAQNGCLALQFFPGDTFDGEVRSNDQFLICGSTFKGAVTSSSDTTPIFKTPSGCGTPDFQVGGKITKVPTIPMPQTNTEMRKETRNDLPSDVPRPGCLYTGPTVIKFTSNGKMNVISPWTKFTNTAATVAGATNPAQCGTPGTGANGLGSATGATVDVLNLNLIFVQNVPAVGAADANAPATAATVPANFACTNANGSTPAGWTFKNGATFIARYPASGEITPYTINTAVKHYDCKAGDIFVQGTLKGQTTLAAEKYIYVTDDVLYSDRLTDVLGLVGQESVLVYNPRNSSSDAVFPAEMNREIDAAILSVGHAFQAQNYDQFDRGTLTVFGSIAQKYRGAVISGSNGYTKNYQYDTKYKTTAPPKFLTPVSTTYGVTQYASVPAAFTPTGAAGP